MPACAWVRCLLLVVPRWAGCCLAAVILVVTASAARAEVKVHGLFSDQMVLQQGVKVPVWGTAADGEKVTVTFGEQKVETTAEKGKWRVDLAPLKPGPAATLTIAGTNRIELKEVLVGEVWICSGQSNMEWPVRQTADPDKYIAESENPNIRLYTVPRERDAKPRSDVRGQWQPCNPKTTPNFSAVAYHFARHLQPKIKVPIGLISTNVGGTAAEEWTCKELLEADPILQPTLRNKNSTTLYNAMIHPLAPFAIRGAIWYQGESNAGRAEQYATLFPTMIKNWRTLWGQGDFPFLFVQLAPWKMIVSEPCDSDWAELREAQWQTTKSCPHTAMAVITDVGDEKDIHPKQKDPVGQRLALAAQSLAYGQTVVFNGPEYEKLAVDGNKAVVHFKHAAGGLKVKGDAVTGFAICGDDKKFYNAQAKIDGSTVVVTCEQVAKPVAVRFGWADFPVVNLFNQEGLPATPFRTDTFPGKTVGRR